MNAAKLGLPAAATLFATALLALASQVSTAGAQTQAVGSASAQHAASTAQRKPPPTPPPPLTDSTLALVSASAAGTAFEGQPCAVSADGGKVLFTSRASGLVSGDTNGAVDIFLKDLNGNGVSRVVSTTSLNAVICLGMTPDARSVAFIADAPTGVVNVLGFGGSESAIMVKNLTTGQQTRVTPLLSTFANVAAYQFAGMSDDGLRVAFIAQPTSTCSGYDCTATGANAAA